MKENYFYKSPTVVDVRSGHDFGDHQSQAALPTYNINLLPQEKQSLFQESTHVFSSSTISQLTIFPRKIWSILRVSGTKYYTPQQKYTSNRIAFLNAERLTQVYLSTVYTV